MKLHRGSRSSANFKKAVEPGIDSCNIFVAYYVTGAFTGFPGQNKTSSTDKNIATSSTSSSFKARLSSLASAADEVTAPSTLTPARSLVDGVDVKKDWVEYSNKAYPLHQGGRFRQGRVADSAEVRVEVIITQYLQIQSPKTLTLTLT